MIRAVGRLIAATVALSVAVSGAPAAGVASPAPSSLPSPAPDVAPDLPVQLVDVKVTPEAPRPHELVRIEGIARTSVPIDARYVTLRVRSTPVTSRSELALAAADSGRLLELTGKDAAIVGPRPLVDDLEPGVDTPWSIEVPVDDLPIEFGVYRISVELFDADYVRQGRVNTFLPYFPAGTWRPTNVAWLWPLVETPHRGASTASAAPSSAEPEPTPSAGTAARGGAGGSTFVDDGLASALGESGRLAALVAGAANAGAQRRSVPPQLAPVASPAQDPGRKRPRRPKPPAVEPLIAQPVPVTWAIDPDLLESAATLARSAPGAASQQPTPKPATSQAPSTDAADNDAGRNDASGNNAPKSDASTAAAAWLTALKSAVGEASVIPLPYADADIVALARSGYGDEVSRALRTARGPDGVFREVLERDVSPTIAWPVDGVITQRALDVLALSQVSTVILADAALPLADPDAHTYTPGMQGAPLSVSGGTVQPLLSDPVLDGLLAEQPTPEDEGLAKQRFLAETALVTAEAPAVSRDILLVPPRQPQAPAYLSSLLSLTGRVPWLRPTTIDESLRHGSDPARRVELEYPQAQRDRELPATEVAQIVATRARLDTLRSMLDKPEVLDAVDHDLFRAYSVSWRDQPQRARDLRVHARKVVDDLIAKVSVITTDDTLTLAGSGSSIPLTVTSSLDQTVRIRVRLTSRNSAQFASETSKVVEVAAGAKYQLKLPATVTAVGSKRLRITATVLTPDGKELFTDELEIRSLGAGGPVLVITYALMGLLFLVVALRLLRRVWSIYGARTAAA